MPSKSAAQAKLMRAVAHNPAFAKKVGVSQSVGQEFMKADKRKGKVKKFELGGPTSYEESGSGGGTNSFKDAFKAARKAGQGTFTWQGKKYTTEMAGEKKAAPAAAAKPAAPKVEVAAPTVAAPKSPKDMQAEADARPGSGAGFRRLAARFGTAGQREKMKGLGYGDEDEGSEESPAMRRIRLAREVAESSRGPSTRGSALKNMSTAERRMYDAGRGMKGGGGVKKYAGGGSVSSASKRADGIASRGKTRCKIV